jgi:hypothetical protein
VGAVELSGGGGEEYCDCVSTFVIRSHVGIEADGYRMWVMSAISGLMVGTQYFRPDDVPL